MEGMEEGWEGGRSGQDRKGQGRKGYFFLNSFLLYCYFVLKSFLLY
jgi:hypothetical protein